MAKMRMSYYSYTLNPKVTAISPVAVRQGALLRIAWPDRVVGYGDCCPLVEFGDRPINEHLYDLGRGRISDLMEQTIWLARRDGEARKEGRNLLAGKPRVRNVFLIPDATTFDVGKLGEGKQVGFSTIKIKCGRDLEKELALLDLLVRERAFRVRLDFNCRIEFQEFMLFIGRIPEFIREKIEFVEDPFPFDPQAWSEGNRVIPIAADLEWKKVKISGVNSVPFKVAVLKPARQDVPQVLEVVNRWGLRLVVTSSFDHPVGIMHAMSVASDLKKSYPNVMLDSGCFTHTYFEANEFSEVLPKKGPWISEIPGTGIGFNDLLEKLPWTALKIPTSE